MHGIKDKVVVITVPSSGIGDCGHARRTRHKGGTRRARLDRLEALARCMAGASGEGSVCARDKFRPADVDVGEIIVRPTAQA